jgi:hypothetical protein
MTTEQIKGAVIEFKQLILDTANTCLANIPADEAVEDKVEAVEDKVEAVEDKVEAKMFDDELVRTTIANELKAYLDGGNDIAIAMREMRARLIDVLGMSKDESKLAVKKHKDDIQEQVQEFLDLRFDAQLLALEGRNMPCFIASYDPETMMVSDDACAFDVIISEVDVNMMRLKLTPQVPADGMNDATFAYYHDCDEDSGETFWIEGDEYEGLGKRMIIIDAKV